MLVQTCNTMFDCSKRLTQAGGRRGQMAETMTITKRICGRVKRGDNGSRPSKTT